MLVGASPKAYSTYIKRTTETSQMSTLALRAQQLMLQYAANSLGGRFTFIETAVVTANGG
jgi:hypothetical protein